MLNNDLYHTFRKMFNCHAYLYIGLWYIQNVIQQSKATLNFYRQ